MATQKSDLLFALDPVAFATKALGFTPDRWQADVLTSTAKRLIMNCCRQSGKSTTSAARALHQAVYRPPSLILLLSPSQRQSSLLFLKIKTLLASVDPQPPLVEDSRLSCTFANGSRIVALPSNEPKIRGYSDVNLIIEDESARVPDDLYRAFRPMLATSGGQLILMSTPYGARGHFYEAWQGGGPGWQKYEVKATDCPRISAQFLEEERVVQGSRSFGQEYLCQFNSTQFQVFSHDLVAKALTSEVKPIFGPNRGPFSRDSLAFIGLDPGKERDHFALAVVERVPDCLCLDKSTGMQFVQTEFHVRHVQQFELKSSYVAMVQQVADLYWSREFPKRPRLVVDRGGAGGPVLDMLTELGLSPTAIYITSGAEAFADERGHNVPKRDLVTNLLIKLESGLLKISEEMEDVESLTRELLAFEEKTVTRTGHETYGAEPGAHDDLLMSVALGLWEASDYHEMRGMIV